VGEDRARLEIGHRAILHGRIPVDGTRRAPFDTAGRPLAAHWRNRKAGRGKMLY